MQTSLTIGNFDGVHLGHRALIQKTLALAQIAKTRPSLLTFEPHPREFLKIRPVPRRICSVQEKSRRIKLLGIENMTVQNFDLAFSSLSGDEFLDFVGKTFNPRHIIVGQNFYFGKNRQGDLKLLSAWSISQGIELEIVPPVCLDGNVVSSSEIRRAIESGEIIRASQLMGFTHRIDCEVVSGEGRGKTLGFPTLNSPLPRYPGIGEICLPPHGVYITNLHAGEATYPAITNFGNRPTFHAGSTEEFFETFLLNLNSNQGEPCMSFKQVTVEFLDRIRPERRFANKDELIQQIQLDVRLARQYHQR